MASKTETQITAVLMEDGSTVNFPGSRKLIKDVELTESGIILHMSFRNGKKLTLAFSKDHPTFLRAAAHGYSQKFGDEAAGIADIDDMVQAVEELVVVVNEKGDWSVRREGGSAGGSVLARALIQATGKSPEAVKQFLAGKSMAEKIALRNSPKIKPIVELLEAEKAEKSGKGIGVDALLNELEAAE